MKKLEYSFVKEYIESFGYKCLSKEYKNNGTKLQLQCPQGHIFEMGWGGFLGGCRCPKCMIEVFAKKQRYTIEYVKKFIEEKGFKCISEEYKNAHGKLKIMCLNGHIFEMRWDCFQQGQRCPYCAGNKKKTYEEIRKEIEKYGYKLLSEKYQNSRKKLEIQCPKGHKFLGSYEHFYNGLCPTCANINMSERMMGSNNPMWRGGITVEPYCSIWNKKELKEFIKFRDHYLCMNPYCFSKEVHLKDIVIHHIDYDKKNCDATNLITVCNSCNSRANKDRKWHKSWYQTILYQRYNYIY